MPRGIRRTTIAALAASLLLVAPATAAVAAPSFDVQDHGAGRFYGNFELEVLLFTGDEVVAICNGAPEPIVSARVFDRQDGGAELRANARDLPIFLYRSPLGAPEFIDQTCGALFDGDPETVPVAPFASGTANFKERISTAPDGYEEHVNGVNGTATSPDGTTFKVRTWADFAIDDGMLIGDPAEFQGLAIHRLGD